MIVTYSLIIIFFLIIITVLKYQKSIPYFFINSELFNINQIPKEAILLLAPFFNNSIWSQNLNLNKSYKYYINYYCRYYLLQNLLKGDDKLCLKY